MEHKRPRKIEGHLKSVSKQDQIVNGLNAIIKKQDTELVVLRTEIKTKDDYIYKLQQDNLQETQTLDRMLSEISPDAS